jgi:hypothetical protein
MMTHIRWLGGVLKLMVMKLSGDETWYWKGIWQFMGDSSWGLNAAFRWFHHTSMCVLWA